MLTAIVRFKILEQAQSDEKGVKDVRGTFSRPSAVPFLVLRVVTTDLGRFLASTGPTF